MNKNILVTGGAGFVGSHLVEYLVGEGHTVTSLDNYSSGYETNHIQGATYLKGSTSAIHKLLKGFPRFDVVYHLGEYSRIAPSFRDIDEVWDANMIGTYKVLKYCVDTNVGKFVYAGSSTRFASEGIDHSPYSFSKAVVADLVKSFYKWYSLPYAICYFYNVFGDRAGNNGYQSVIDIFANQYSKGEPLTVCGTGYQRRTFTYVKDIVRGLALASEYEHNEEFQLNDVKEYTILEIVKMFGGEVKMIPARPGDRSCSITTDNKSRELLNWETTMSVDTWIQHIKEKE
jgi:UDP-glucose 4-epimerase